MTATQMSNATALFEEIAKIPETERPMYITMMRTLLLGARLAEQAREPTERQAG